MPQPKNKTNNNTQVGGEDLSDKPDIKPFVIIGIVGLLVFLGGFIVWAIFSSLESAAIAEGKLIAETKNKTIKHLEGGIIETIHIQDGDKVERGQLLITLDDTKPQAALEAYQKRYDSLLAEKARLIAERDDQQTITWPEALANKPNVKKIQQNIMKANVRSVKGQLSILNKQVEQLKKEIQSYQARLVAGKEQLSFILEELEMYQKLRKKNLIELPKVLEMKRKSAELTGSQGQFRGMIAKAEQKIGETQQQIITLQDDYKKEVLKELKAVQDELSEVKPSLDSAQDTLNRTTITSPNEGIVVGLTQFTKGGVISPGESLMNIFPSRDKLIAEANVNPADIELVAVGQKARVYLTAYKQRNTPSLLGEVTNISADVFVDENTGRSFYRAYIKIPETELNKIDDVQLYPGMNVRVMIVTDKHSPLNYFLTPIRDSFRFAFREK